MSYRSLRRRYLDAALTTLTATWGGDIVDIGGERVGERGNFLLLEGERIRRTVVNLDPSALPDELASATNLPFQDESFDFALLCETLEHLSEPEAALLELSRVLKVSGVAIVSMPFIYRIHGDPDDYQRWTESKLETVAKRAGLSVDSFLWLGGGLAATFDAVQSHLQLRTSTSRSFWPLLRAFQMLAGLVLEVDKFFSSRSKIHLFSGGWIATLRK